MIYNLTTGKGVTFSSGASIEHLFTRCGVYIKSYLYASRAQLSQWRTMLHTMMTSQILFFSLLPAFVYAADAQVTLPRDPLCACTVNAPPGSRDCGQPYGYGADDNCVKKSAFLALQTLVKELQQELATTKAGIVNRQHFKQESSRYQH